MPRYSIETKIAACKDYYENGLDYRDIYEKYGIEAKRPASSILCEWITKYGLYGEAAFSSINTHQAISSSLKKDAVKDYLAGKGSYREIAAKYGVRSKTSIQKWVLEYNANKELKDYNPNREVYMAEARRKTTVEERIKIVHYCINHSLDYKATAALFSVSYSQVYNWVKKYNADGEDALMDRRGRRKADDEVDELECLRRENQRLKRRLEEKDMLVQLLKKVKEIERK